MTVSISPIWNGFQFFDNSGLPLNGGLLYQYQAGSTTLQRITYSDSDGVTSNANPIVLDSSGRIPVEMYLTDGQAYKFVLTDPTGEIVYAYVDNIIGVQASVGGGGGGGGGTTGAVWNSIADAPSFVSVNSFVIPNSYVGAFAIGNRVQVSYGGTSFSYGTVSAVSYASPNTHVTIVNDNTILNSSMTAVFWSTATVAGPIVDAGAVTYELPSSYTTTYTAGYQIKTLNTAVDSLSTRISDTYLVLPATGTPNYAVTTDPTITSYSVGQRFTIAFAGGSTGAATLNINGLGAQSLFMYSSSAALVNPTIPAGFVADVAYDGAEFIMLTQIPPGPYTPSVAPVGGTVFRSNGTWTCPANVFGINVLCVGGGGSGSTGGYSSGESPYLVPGGDGGSGGVAFNRVSVVPGNTYTITIGSGGIVPVGDFTAGNPGGSTVFGSGSVLTQASGGGGGYVGSVSPPPTGTPGYPALPGTCVAGLYGNFFYSGNNGFQVPGVSQAIGIGGTGQYISSPITNLNGTSGMIALWW